MKEEYTDVMEKRERGRFPGGCAGGDPVPGVGVPDPGTGAWDAERGSGADDAEDAGNRFRESRPQKPENASGGRSSGENRPQEREVRPSAADDPSPEVERDVAARLERMREFFGRGLTREPSYRIDALRRLRRSVKRHEADIFDALHADLHKSAAESYMTEVAQVLAEADYQIRHVKGWSRPRRVSAPLFLRPSRSAVLPQPAGAALIMSPWNYPLNLSLVPLAGAVGAGCCAALRPSGSVPHTREVIERIVSDAFPKDYVTVFSGGHDEGTALLRAGFDRIFFTGSTSFGRRVMAEAARTLTPVTLELGGKSPCIVDTGARLDMAARRIAWGKLLNAGQTCVAPDYVLVQAALRDELIERLALAIEKGYTADPQTAPDYPRIVGRDAFLRLQALIGSSGRVAYGGRTDEDDLYIQPTVLTDVRPDDPVMQEEVFGPVLPVLTFDTLGDALRIVRSHPHPLALYYFGPANEGRRVLEGTSSGGACINDVVVQLSNPRLPFGGVRQSGIGRYHGRASFDTFTDCRSVVVSSASIDPPFRYAPFRSVKFYKRFM